jgi:hypothetical protein
MDVDHNYVRQCLSPSDRTNYRTKDSVYSDDHKVVISSSNISWTCGISSHFGLSADVTVGCRVVRGVMFSSVSSRAQANRWRHESFKCSGWWLSQLGTGDTGTWKGQRLARDDTILLRLRNAIRLSARIIPSPASHEKQDLEFLQRRVKFHCPSVDDQGKKDQRRCEVGNYLDLK